MCRIQVFQSFNVLILTGSLKSVTESTEEALHEEDKSKEDKILALFILL